MPVPANANALIEARGYGGQRIADPAPVGEATPQTIHYSGTLQMRQSQADRDNIARRRRIARALRLRGI